MDILRRIQEYAVQHPQRIAVRSGSKTLTYEQLWRDSERLAGWLLLNAEAEKHPVAVYGHKHPWMLVCFLACVKSGRAYCPIDVSVPDARVEMILQTLPSSLVLTTEELRAQAGDKRVVGLEELREILRENETVDRMERDNSAGLADSDASVLPAGRSVLQESEWVSGSGTYYIIFTSGSTGTPKGVQITADCLNHYLDWAVGLGNTSGEKLGSVFLNQAPFSFDLSVMDLYTSLASGGTLYCLEKAVQSDYRLLMQSLGESEANVWVSTPSFADVCLSEPSFSEKLMPGLRVFLFCGETLGNRTARKLRERFPKAQIINTYGPTESTVAVTDVLITPELAQREDPLPVGKAKPGTRIEIHDAEGNILPDGEKGEIIIIGDTVSTGYYGRTDLTEKAFFHYKSEHTGTGQVRGYKTGDKGYLKDGMLYYCGRIDLQIKLHGYRIELEDIENNVRKLPGIEHAVVVPNSRGGRITSLTAYVVKRPEAAGAESEDGTPVQTGESKISGVQTEENKVSAMQTEENLAIRRQVKENETLEVQAEECETPGGHTEENADAKRAGGQSKRGGEGDDAAALREALRQYLPDYMIPKKFVFLDQMPMTNNGKADRKLLGGKNG